MTTCGVCVCPTPEVMPTAAISDLCTAYNNTHVICNMSGSYPNFSEALFGGIFIGVMIVIGLLIIHRLFPSGGCNP